MATAELEKAPKGEIGVIIPNAGVFGWGALGGTMFIDQREFVDPLRWPNSVETFERMATDSQLAALMRGTILPTTRWATGIDENGADQAMVARACNEFNLPLIDDAILERRNGRSPTPIGRSKNRFSFSKHQHEALTALAGGHAYFEKVVDTVQDGDPGANGGWVNHLKKLKLLPPWTIHAHDVDPITGGLIAIRQQAGLDGTMLPVNRLAAYIWGQGPGDWIGTSMYRPCYREWLIKDRLLRVDAQNHENAGGRYVPIAPKDSTLTEREAIARAAAVAGTPFGPNTAFPEGTELMFARATGSDVIASINRHDEAMSRAFLLMQIQLGSTQTGSRAVGDVQQELWGYSQEATVIWFLSVFNEHVLEDWVDWNYGAAVEYVPRLAMVNADTQPAAGLAPDVTLDPAITAALQGASPAKVAAIRASYEREDRSYRSRLAKALPLLFTEEELSVIDTDELLDRDAVVTDALHAAISDASVKPTRTKPALAGAAVSLPDRPLRRDPTETEVRAAVDFKQIDLNWQSQVDLLVTEWQTIRATQIDELSGLIESANSDLIELAQIAATAAGGDLIEARLKTMAQLGSSEAAAEAARQGVTSPSAADLADLETELSARAFALEQLLASALSQAAANKAVQLSGGGLEPSEVAAGTHDYLSGLTDTYLSDQFSGALSAAQNAGRLATMQANDAKTFYASEILDTNTCQPCEDVDGTEYSSAADAAKDYPAGGYRDCAGGPRCRGTVVAVYDETEASA